jgi:invasion protein IalB
MSQVGGVVRPPVWKRMLSWRMLLRGALVAALLVVAAVALALLIVGGVVVGQNLIGGSGPPNETRVTTFTDWRVICPPFNPEQPNCALTLDVLRDTGGVLLTVSMLDPVPNAPLSITVPHGVALDAGMGFTVGADPMRVRPFETCNNTGCIALVTVDADTLRSLSTNMGGQVVVAVAGNTSPVTIPFSLNGFADGYAELQRAKARRTSFFGFLDR